MFLDGAGWREGKGASILVLRGEQPHWLNGGGKLDDPWDVVLRLGEKQSFSALEEVELTAMGGCHSDAYHIFSRHVYSPCQALRVISDGFKRARNLNHLPLCRGFNYLCRIGKSSHVKLTAQPIKLQVAKADEVADS